MKLGKLLLQFSLPFRLMAILISKLFKLSIFAVQANDQERLSHQNMNFKKYLSILLLVFLQQMLDNIQSGNPPASDRRLTEYQLNQRTPSQNYPPLYPINSNVQPNTMQPNGPINRSTSANLYQYKDYQLSIMKTVLFMILAFIVVIVVGVEMGNCPTSYKNKQICQVTYSYSYYDYYYGGYDTYYGSSSRMTQTECCDPVKILFGVYLGTLLAYLLVNALVLVVQPPSMSDYFITILLYSRVGKGGQCCPNSCFAILYFMFWPIFALLAVISGIVYLFSRCCKGNQY